MPVIKKKTPQIIRLDEHDPQFMETECAASSDARLNLDPRIKAVKVEIIPIDDISPNPRSARKHSDRKISTLAYNIEKFGFWVPIVLDEDNVIQRGHARWLAARHIGMRHLPAFRDEDLSPAARRIVAIADNRLSEWAEWDFQILGEEFNFLESLDIDVDLHLTGFDTVEIDRMLDVGAKECGDDPADDVPEIDPEAAAVTQPGDLWRCGEHVLLCGDALAEADYATVMDAERAQIVFTDPPYNVPNAGHVTKRNDVREFAMAHGEMSSDQFTGFLRQAATNLRGVMTDGAVAYLCIDWRHMIELRSAADPVFGQLKNTIVWVKPNAGMGSFYRSQHELIFVYRTPGKTVNNFGLGAKGRHRSNVWNYPGLTSFGRGREETLASHPTVKPVAMVKDALKDCAHRGDIVLDPFGGSGTTMIAAEATGRRARLMEIDPLYCDTIVKRWQTFTGKQARLNSDETFADAKARRTDGKRRPG